MPMFWDDIVEIKSRMEAVENEIKRVHFSNQEILNIVSDESYLDLMPSLYERLDNIGAQCKRTGDGIPILLALTNPENVCETYEKHIKKLEEMMLEFKGCISMARSAIAERKELNAEEQKSKRKAKKKVCPLEDKPSEL
jgi:hypothetical protein